MAKVFELLYGNEKSKKYIIFTLITLYCCFTISQSMSFFVNYGNLEAREVLQLIKYVLAFIVLVYFVADFVTGKTKIDALFVVLAIWFFVVFLVAHSALFLVFLLFLYELKQYKFNDFLKFALAVLSILLLGIVVASLIGIIPDLMIPRGDGRFRHSLGFDCGPYSQTFFLFIVLMSVYLYKTKLPFVAIFAEIGVAVFFYCMTLSRADFCLILLILAIILILKIVEIVRKKELKIKIPKWLTYCLVAVPIVLVVLYAVLTCLWPTQTEFIIKMNDILSGRLHLTYDSLQNYGITIFGQSVYLLDDFGNYNGVDNAFFNRLVYNGIVNALIMLCAYCYMVWNASKKNDGLLLLALMVVICDSFVGPIMFCFHYNLFAFALMDMFDARQIVKAEREEKYQKVSENMNKNKSTYKDVCAIVVTYNRKELLRENIMALKAQTYKHLTILIIDNASTDGTKEYIADLVDDAKVKYFNTGANLGGAGGFNYGMKQAVLMGCDYVWVMDDDCIPNIDSLNALYENAQKLDNNFGYLSSKVLWKDGTPCRMNIQKTSLGSKVNTNSTELTKIKMASFVSLFLKRETIEEFGLPIKDFFIWGDDLEYTNRISKDCDCYYCPESVVIHKCATNVGSNIVKDSDDRLDRYKYAYRNECYLYRQNGFGGIAYMLTKIWFHTFKVLFSKAKDKKKRIKIIHSSTRHGFKFNPKIEYVFNENTQVNVLEFFGEPLEYGGQEAFMLNMYEKFEAKNIKYTLCTPFDLTNEKLIKLAESRNETIVHYDYQFFSKFRKKYILKAAKKILKENKFDVIHIQSGSIYCLLNVAKIAKKSGVKQVIVHSHSTGKYSFKYKIIKWFSDRKIEKYADKFFACSKIAGEFKFPKSVMDDNKCLVIKNGIETSTFQFDKTVRKSYREKLQLKPGELTILHVGRFAEQKNHKFLIEIVEKLKEQLKNFKVILVGEGELKEKTLLQIKEKGLEQYFIILGKRDDVAKIMMACDMFVFPSIFEGLGIVAVEAQCSGLKTLVSKQIPEEANITDLITYLDFDADVWVQTILKQKGKKVEREKYAKAAVEQGYDEKMSAQMLENIYLGE